MNSNLVYDVGAHKGEDTEFYLKKGYSVVAIEAHPDLAEIIRLRFPDEIRSGRLVIIAAAIAPTAGTIEFFANKKHSVWGTTERKWAERNRRQKAPSDIREVAAVKFDSVLSEYGIPYYLKVDIEGADLLCLEALKKTSVRPKYISIEAGETEWNGLCTEFKLFRALGYDRFKIVDQGTVEGQVAPLPASEGNYAAHVFESGSSGLFGDEIPGDWMTETEALNAYRPIHVCQTRFGSNSLGRKVVKWTPFLRRFKHLILPSWHDTHARYRESEH